MYHLSDLVLKKLFLRNWLTYREAEVTFPSSGLVWVNGRNLVAAGKLESVGTGKTGLGEAICRTLTGVPGRFARLGDFSRKKQGDTYIKLEAELRGRPLVVEAGYRCQELSQTGEGLKFEHGGVKISRGHIADTRAELTLAVGVSEQLAPWTVFVDGDNLNFAKLSEQDAVELVMATLAQPNWTRWYDVAKKTSTTFTTSLTEASAKHQAAKDHVTRTAKDLDDAQAELQRLEEQVKDHQAQRQQALAKIDRTIAAKRQDVNGHKQAIERLKRQLKKVEQEKATQYHALEASKLATSTRLTTARERRDTALEARSEAKSKQVDAKDVLDEMRAVPKTCPTCDKPWDKAHAKQEITKQEQLVKQLRAAMDQKTRIYDLDQAVVVKVEGELEELDAKLRQLRVDTVVRQLSRECQDHEDDIDELQAAITGLERDKAEQPDHEAPVKDQRVVVEERQRVAQQAKEAVEATAMTLAEAQEATKVVRYWVQAFSPAGIPNMVLEESIAALNSVAKRISTTLTGDTLAISFHTQQELASSDATRSKLHINVNNPHGATSFHGSSKGESRLTNLIIAETFSCLGNFAQRVGFRWYDEVLNSQDPLVRKSILAYLRDTARQHGALIFVVDHHPETANYADHVLLVEKDAEGTTARWQ